MKTCSSIIIAAILALFIQSCAKDSKIDWELESHADLLVVESLITSDSVFQNVKLTLSNPYYDSKAPRTVSDATVTISNGKKVYTFSESLDQKGLYSSQQKFACKSGETYELSIRLKDQVNSRSEYKSIAKMPHQGIVMDSIRCEIYEMPEFDFEEKDSKKEKDTTLLAVYYFGDEKKSSQNYYFTKVYRNSKPLHDSAREFFATESQQEEGYTHVTTFNKNVANDDLITFKLYTVERGYYKYLEAIRNMDQTGMATSMSGPPANAVGNIPNALGFFVVAFESVQTSKAIDYR